MIFWGSYPSNFLRQVNSFVCEISQRNFKTSAYSLIGQKMQRYKWKITVSGAYFLQQT